MPEQITSNTIQYVDVMEKRARGLLPEMGSAIRLCEVMKSLNINQRPFTIMDIGCATGHYYRSLTSRGLSPSRYIGVDIDPNMISAAQRIWNTESNPNSMVFTCGDPENLTPVESPTVDHIICMNAFMYFISGEKALEYMISHARYSIIIRAYFADSSFKVIRSQTASNHNYSTIKEADSIDREGNFKCYDLWNIYSFEYIESLVSKLGSGALRVSWLEDKNYQTSIVDEEVVGVEKRAGTQLIGGHEVSYPIIQPWQYLVISRK